MTTTPVTAGDAVALCDRFTGVGADGVLVLGPGADGADATMTLTNADGSIAEMSGNGARCLAWVARRARAWVRPTRLVVDTGGGRRTLDLTLRRRGRRRARGVRHGRGHVRSGRDPASPYPSADDIAADVDGGTYTGDAAGIGNPHWVIAVDGSRRGRPRLASGRCSSTIARFPARVNVEFVVVDGPDRMRMRVWERGVGRDAVVRDRRVRVGRGRAPARAGGRPGHGDRARRRPRRRARRDRAARRPGRPRVRRRRGPGPRCGAGSR